MTETGSRLDFVSARSRADNWWALLFHRSPEWTTWTEEQLAWKQSVSLWDLTGPPGMGEYFGLSGRDARRLLSDTCVNSFEHVVPGSSRHLIACREDGRLLMDTVCMVMGENAFEISFAIGPLAYAARDGSYDVSFETLPPRTKLQVAGPRSFELLQRLTDADLGSIKFTWFNPEPVEFAGHEAFLLRITMSGEQGFEIQCPLEAHDDLLTKVLEAGADLDLRRIGALNHLSQHVEAAIPLAGVDFLPAILDCDDPYMDWLSDANDVQASFLSRAKLSGSFESTDAADYYASPIDLGWGSRVHLDHAFPGDAALAAELADPRRRMVTLEWDAEGVVDVYRSMFSDGEPYVEIDTPHYDHMDLPRDPKLPLEASAVLNGDECVGFTTSRTYSYAYRRMLSLCIIPVELSAVGTEVTILWGNPGHSQKRIRARVARAPYKANRTTVPATVVGSGGGSGS